MTITTDEGGIPKVTPPDAKAIKFGQAWRERVNETKGLLRQRAPWFYDGGRYPDWRSYQQAKYRDDRLKQIQQMKIAKARTAALEEFIATI